jgi:hypothetical protein
MPGKVRLFKTQFVGLSPTSSAKTWLNPFLAWEIILESKPCGDICLRQSGIRPSAA